MARGLSGNDTRPSGLIHTPKYRCFLSLAFSSIDIYRKQNILHEKRGRKLRSGKYVHSLEHRYRLLMLSAVHKSYRTMKCSRPKIQTPNVMDIAFNIVKLLGLVHVAHGLTVRSFAIFIQICHDDVIKWKHFPRNWPFVWEIHLSPVNSPHKGQWRGALMFFLFCALINGWGNNRDAGDLRRHRAHYDVIVL